MPSTNLVLLAGNLTRPPDVRRTNNGTAVAAMGLAINERRKDQQGNAIESTVFIDIEAWGKTAEYCRDYLQKGAAVLIQGRLKVDSWDDKQTGAKRSKVLVTADRVQNLSGRPPQSQNGEQPQQHPPQQPQQRPPAGTYAQTPTEPVPPPPAFPTNPNTDPIDDIPF